MKKKAKVLETWFDPQTELEWQIEEPGKMSFEDAINYAKNLDLADRTDWRLPIVEELETLLDRGTYNPALKEEVPFRSSSYYWSSTIYAPDDRFVWGVGFYSGGINYYGQSDNVDVRCVRMGP